VDVDLVEVDHVRHTDAHFVASVLSSAGLNPHYDEARRKVIDGEPLTPVYVPAVEVEQARAVLAKWRQENERNARRRPHEIATWIGIPLLVSVGVGVAVFWMTDAVEFVIGAALISFVFVLHLWSIVVRDWM